MVEIGPIIFAVSFVIMTITVVTCFMLILVCRLYCSRTRMIERIKERIRLRLTMTRQSARVGPSTESTPSRNVQQLEPESVPPQLLPEADYPREWDEHTIEDGDLKLVQLYPQSNEYFDISTKLEVTLPNVVIESIKRIQNKLLWKKYTAFLILRNTEFTEQLLLFHGTSDNNPSLIYGGDNSFDMRYSRQGFWGRGNYFAVNASYSDSYAHKINVSGQESRQLLVARVITGTPFHSRPNSELREPPILGTRRGVQVHYDCVKGETGGSIVYITYENDRAYPMYLITYHYSPTEGTGQD